MTRPDNQTTNTAPWVDAWVHWQRHALEQWVKQTGSGGSAAFAQGLDSWLAALAPAGVSEGADVARRLFDVGRAYLLSLGQVAAQLGSAAAPAAMEGQAGRQFIDSLRQAQSLFSGAVGPPISEVVDAWKRLAGSSSGIWQTLSGRGPAAIPGADPWSMLGAGLDTATMGISREYQEDLQALARAMLEYQRRLDAMATLVGKVHAASVELLMQRLEEKGRQGQPIATFRAIYDLWIECGEQTFQQTAHGDEYARLQAELTNAYAALRLRQQALSERVLAALNMPNRAEMDTTHRRVKELRQRVDALECAIAELRGRVDAQRAARPKMPPRGSRRRSRSAGTAGQES